LRDIYRPPASQARSLASRSVLDRHAVDNWLAGRQEPVGQTFNTVADRVKLALWSRNPVQEWVRLHAFDADGKLLATLPLPGLRFATYVDPVRWTAFVRHWAGHGAASFSVSHNHPSGDPAPSVEDVQLAERVRDEVKEAGKDWLGMINTDDIEAVLYAIGHKGMDQKTLPIDPDQSRIPGELALRRDLEDIGNARKIAEYYKATVHPDQPVRLSLAP
jgi:hypothetical protein